MATPNMATITASLERSLQNCSLNHQHSITGDGDASESPLNPSAEAASATPTLELNSEGSLPFHWEQCLDLKTGEIYYINWRTGMKATEDPRTEAAEYYSVEEDGDSSSYGDSEDSFSESSPSSSREQWSGNNNNSSSSNNQDNNFYYQENENNNSGGSVLVVAGCKRCLMYYMVPKQLQICPKCCGQLLHFDRSENSSSSS